MTLGELRELWRADLHRWGLMRLWLRRLRYRFGIDVPASTRVGPGLYISHPGGIVVHSEAVIGRNCNLSHGVTVGEANRGPRKRFPVIGDGGSVVAGVPARVISHAGAVGNINHTDY
jgi:serine O-acetyltransferase